MLAVLPTSSDLDPRTSEVRGITTQTELSVTGRLRVRVRVLQSHRAGLRGTAVHEHCAVLPGARQITLPKG
jgi:hypothetical protein